MRLRGLGRDHWWDAGMKRAVLLGATRDPREYPKGWDPELLARLDDPAFEAAQPGDCWRIRWVPQSPRTNAPAGWPLAGYALTCPAENCTDGVHLWTDAANCSCRQGDTCCHEGAGSCWTWTGSPEAGNLSASPSLHASEAACGWHGFLRGGEMVSA